MDGVRLNLNPEKTEFTIIGDGQARESIVQKFPPSFLETQSPPLMKVRIKVLLLILEIPLPVI